MLHRRCGLASIETDILGGWQGCEHLAKGVIAESGTTFALVLAPANRQDRSKKRD